MKLLGIKQKIILFFSLHDSSTRDLYICIAFPSLLLFFIKVLFHIFCFWFLTLSLVLLKVFVLSSFSCFSFFRLLRTVSKNFSFAPKCNLMSNFFDYMCVQGRLSSQPSSRMILKYVEINQDRLFLVNIFVASDRVRKLI